MVTTLGDLDRRLRERETLTKLSRMGKKYMVMSGKGGVGKTTLAAGLAMAKARDGKRTGLLDIDFHGPNVAGALFLTGKVEANEKGRLIPMEAYPNLHVLSVQSLLDDPDDAVLWRGPRKLRAINQFIGEAEWPELDYFIIDSPPGTGDEALTSAKTIPDLKGILVTTGHSLSLADAAKAAGFLKTVGSELFGIVDSLGSLICPDCRKEIVLYDKEITENLARKLSSEVLVRIPWDLEAARLSETLKKPVLDAAPDSALSAKIRELAARL
jgi:Mrp family chromosome partitioning ATPase